MMRDFLVYTIIATYNGERWIRKCLNSLNNSSHPIKVIVIDNGSTDNTLAIIESSYHNVQVIRTGNNLGFGRANNIGLKIAMTEKADYVFLLNQDAWVEVETISELISAHLGDGSLGVLSPLHVNGEGTDFDPIFYDYFIGSDIRDLVRSVYFADTLPVLIVNTKFVNAAAWLISNACLTKTGGFDPIFYHYGEDNNYAHRVLYNGFRIGIVCSTRVFHDKEYKTGELNKILKQASTHDFKHDRIIFLHQACDIQNKDIGALFFKRFCRFSFSGLVGLVTFNRQKSSYNFRMAITVIVSLNKILKSRKNTITNETPYLA